MFSILLTLAFGLFELTLRFSHDRMIKSMPLDDGYHLASARRSGARLIPMGLMDATNARMDERSDFHLRSNGTYNLGGT
jgi:hypothetical protein